MSYNSFYLVVTVVVLISLSTEAQVTDPICPLLNEGNHVKCNSEIDISITGISYRKIFLAETSFRRLKHDKQENVLQYFMTEAKLVLKEASEIPTNDSVLQVSPEAIKLMGTEFTLELFFPENSNRYNLNFSAPCNSSVPKMKEELCKYVQNQIPIETIISYMFNNTSYNIPTNVSARVHAKQSTDINSFWPLLSKMKVDIFSVSNSTIERNQFGILDSSHSGLPDLIELSINGCNVMKILPGSFTSWRNVEVLDLSENSLNFIPIGLKDLIKLKSLDLSNQKHVSEFFLNFEEFATLSHLEKLNMSNLQIKDILKETFAPLTSLRELDLSHCGLHFLPELVFANLTRLTFLRISDNYFFRFFTRIFSYLAPGAKIYVRNNGIINEQSLYLNQLSVLDFSYNKISSPENMVKSGYVDSLNLSHNQIQSWKMLYTFHSDYHGYKNVDLSNNLINEITTEMGRSMDLVTSIDLGGNHINCSKECSLLQLQNWFKSKRTELLLFNSTQDLKCTEPSSHANISVLDIKLSSRVCKHKSQKDSGIKLIILISMFVITGALTALIIYVYRFELSYIRYLWSMKRHSTQQQEKDRENCDYDVFVSYSRKDRDWVLDVLVPYLESPTERYVLCLHERDFRLGSYIMDNISTCIDRSRRVLFILSNSFLESEWCKWELRMATHRVFEQSFNNFLILLELERVPRDRLPLSLRLLMASRTYLEWPDEGGKRRSIGREAFWRRMKLALGDPLADMQPAHTAIQNSNTAEDDDENSYDSMSDTPENINLLTYRTTDKDFT